MPRVPTTILAALCLAACSARNRPSAPQLDADVTEPREKPAIQPFRWSGVCAGASAPINTTTLYVAANCHIANLGFATVVGTEIITPNSTGYNVSIRNSYTTTNGDHLYTEGDVIAEVKQDLSGMTFTGVETVTGGTGRFANATGSATRIGSTSRGDRSGSWVNIGTLAFRVPRRN